MHTLAAMAVQLALAGGGGEPARSATGESRGLPRFEGLSSPLDRATRERVTGGSWHRGCPVGLADLRLLRLTHLGFDGEAHRGRLIVHSPPGQGTLIEARLPCES